MSFKPPKFPVYSVRFKGHLTCAVKSGISRKPILLRAKKNEPAFESPVEPILDTAGLISQYAVEHAHKVARLFCARAIKRTEEARRRLRGDHLLRGTEIVERLLRDHKQTRRGKRWKICKVEGATFVAPKSITPANEIK